MFPESTFVVDLEACVHALALGVARNGQVAELDVAGPGTLILGGLLFLREQWGGKGQQAEKQKVAPSHL